MNDTCMRIRVSFRVLISIIFVCFSFYVYSNHIVKGVTVVRNGRGLITKVKFSDTEHIAVEGSSGGVNNAQKLSQNNIVYYLKLITVDSGKGLDLRVSYLRALRNIIASRILNSIFSEGNKRFPMNSLGVDAQSFEGMSVPYVISEVLWSNKSGQKILLNMLTFCAD